MASSAPLRTGLPDSMSTAPETGGASLLLPGLLRLTAPNASPLTQAGTNTWLIGDSRLCIVDPGPDDPRHLAAILQACQGRPVDAIVVTHAHSDHSALAPALSRATGAPALARGPAHAGRSAAMVRLSEMGLPSLGDGTDSAFRPDTELADGQFVPVEGGQLEVLHTPGHFGNHICLGWEGMLLSGDHVMGWATSIVSPPDGDMGDYMSSLHRLSARRWTACLPGHGAVVTDADSRIAMLIAHRMTREAAVRDALSNDPQTLPEVTARAYGDVAPDLLAYAARSCLAHLIDLAIRGHVQVDAPHGPAARYRRANR